MAAAASLPAIRAVNRTLRLAPTLPDLVFAMLLVALFGRAYSWQALLSDGDTGWHIRAGEYILDHGMPARDLFSFSRAGQPWCAWEWLSEVIFGQLHRCWGLAGVAVLGALLVCLTSALLFAWLLRRGVGAAVALAATLAAASAASVHYLARPHLFSLLLLVAGLWLLDEDRRSPTPWLWTLVPVAGLWANLHGGFAAWLGILGLLVVLSAVERNRVAFGRYGLLTALSSLATLINPYGWQLHRHIFEYLGSQWIVEHVEEFQSPQIRSESTVVFTILLLAGIWAAALGRRPSQWFEAGLVLCASFAALRSARYIPLFAVVAAPVIAAHLARWWERKAKEAEPRSASRVLWESSQALGAHNGFSLWLPILGVAAVSAVFPVAGLADFPGRSFPVEAVSRNSNLLASSAAARLLTSDQWGNYVIYRIYPRARVFYDGRSDFYGQRIGEDYQVLLEAGRRSREIMDRYGFTAALLPLDWPLGQILEQEPDWRVQYRDRQAVLLLRVAGK